MTSSRSPRSAWGPLLQTLTLPAEDGLARRAALEKVRYHLGLGAEIINIFDRQIAAETDGGETGGKLNLPSDLMRNRGGGLRPPLRKLWPGTQTPSPFPFDFTLSPLIAGQNDVWPFHQAIPTMAAGEDQKILVLYAADDLDAAVATLTGLARQRGAAALEVLVLAPDANDGFRERAAGLLPGVRLLPHGPLSRETAALVETALDRVDGVAYLSGRIEMDAALFDRAAQMLRVSDKVVQGLWPLDDSSLTPFAVRSAGVFKRRYPFRDLKGLNLIIPAALLRRAGGLNPRFVTASRAAQELGWRCYNFGAWFSPLLTAGLTTPEDGQDGSDQALFRQLCPNPWDRAEDGIYEIPKVSIYIPAYNCEKYIESAIGSVLEQDLQDLEVCIAVDGSPDGTMEALERSFGDDPRVRFEDDLNGGIGHASNRAIHMGRGMYVGQLDSDDRLKPGAVRRLADYLDENPDVTCVYGSCERIDADGNFIKPEYSWPQFSREKMMVTSIAHHFRMFRRAAWERTEKFRADIINAVDYDIFLKLMDTGRLHHIDEPLYQRRWHGENTSNVNEQYQTANTYHVQREALKRMGLDRFWDIHIPDPDDPRRVTYRRDRTKPRVLFWPDYSRANPYQHLLYQELRDSHEVIAAPIETAVELIDRTPKSGPLIFHLHWTNFLFLEVPDATTARMKVASFLADLRHFRAKGGRIVWTVHNLISHESPYRGEEEELIREIIRLADAIHFHTPASVPEVAAHFDLPAKKVRIAPHGSYLGVYPDHIDRDAARDILDVAPGDELIVYTGQIRPYKGIEDLVAAFRVLLPDRPRLRLVIAGEVKYDLEAALAGALSEDETARVTIIDRFLDESEFQIFYRAADVAAFPYKAILTSGSMLLALSFGAPVAIPAVGMTREALGGGAGGIAYDASEPDGLSRAISDLLARGDVARTAAVEAAKAHRWTGMKRLFGDLAPQQS